MFLHTLLLLTLFSSWPHPSQLRNPWSFKITSHLWSTGFFLIHLLFIVPQQESTLHKLGRIWRLCLCVCMHTHTCSCACTCACTYIHTHYSWILYICLGHSGLTTGPSFDRGLLSFIRNKYIGRRNYVFIHLYVNMYFNAKVISECLNMYFHMYVCV